MKGVVAYDLATNNSFNRISDNANTSSDVGKKPTSHPHVNISDTLINEEAVIVDINWYKKRPLYFCENCLYYKACPFDYNLSKCTYYQEWNDFAEKFMEKYHDDRFISTSGKTKRKSGN